MWLWWRRKLAAGRWMTLLAVPKAAVLSVFMVLAAHAGLNAAPLRDAPIAVASTASAASGRARPGILLLSSHGYGRPGVETYIQTFVTEASRRGFSINDIMVEHLDLNRMRDPELRRLSRDLLLRKYAGRRIDLIVALQQPAVNLLLTELGTLAPGAPVMSVLAGLPPQALSGRHAFLHQPLRVDVEGTVSHALALFPKTRRVVCLVGTGEDDIAIKGVMAKALARWQGRLEVEYTDTLTYAQMLQRMAALPARTIVLQGLYNRDSAGVSFLPAEVADDVFTHANVPAFGLFDTGIGKNMVGGSVLSIVQEGQAAAAHAVDIALGKNALPDGVTLMSPHFVPMFDWREIQRWRGDAASLPADSVVLNRPQTLWETYRTAVIATAVVFAVLLTLLGLLLIQNRRTVRAEKALQELNAGLEQRVSERTAQLEAANVDLAGARDAAQEATRIKSEFLANMSHEIRTPMNAILGMSDLALRTDLSTRQQGYLGHVKGAAKALLQIVNDILDFSKVEAGKLELAPQEFLLNDVLDKLVAVVGLKAGEKELDFLVDVAADVPLTLEGDPQRLGQVLVNLCANAVKFTASGEVLLKVRLDGSDADRVTLRFEVCDTGIGMDASRMSGLFQPFSQLDASTTRLYGGTGLGLAICKQLVALMKGDIGVVSQPGQGSVFHFSASFGPGRTQAPPEPVAPEGLHGLRVLVVEDNASARAILRTQLRAMGFVVDVAEGAPAGLSALVRAMAARRAFDLVVLDSRLPQSESQIFMAAVSGEGPPGTRPRILLMAPYGLDQPIDARMASQAEGMVSCPVSQHALLDAIATCFGSPLRGEPPAVQSAFGAVDMVAAPTESQRRILRGRKVLLVEDNHINQLVAAELLGDVLGMQVELASDGEQAVARVASSHFDVVLMDVQMPLMDGFRATTLIRQARDAASLPIIGMTAHAMARDREKCIAVGMNDYVTKPFEPQDLFAVLVKWVAGDEAAVQDDAASISMARPHAHANDTSATHAGAVSVDLGLRRCMGREDLYARLVRRFSETQHDDAELIRAALARGDTEAAARLAHQQISTAGTLGAEGLSEAARALQVAVDAGEASRWPDLLAVFSLNHQQVMIELLAYLRDSEQASERTPAPMASFSS
jgi:signal transduction histidine kinase/DNA-binding response OmpR family regulator